MTVFSLGWLFEGLFLPRLRAVGLLCALLLIAASSSSCQPAESVETVRLWHAYRGAERTAIASLVDEFNASRSDLRIEVLPVASKAYKTKLTSSIPRGNGPDLFIEAHELVGEWSDGQLIEPALPGTELAPFAPRSVDALRYRGSVWGVPVALKSLALFRNRGLVPQEPASFAEVVALGRASGVRPLAWETGEFFFQVPFAHGFGARVFDAEGRIRLDTEEMAGSMDFVAELVASGDLPREADGAKVSTLFNQGEVAFVINGPWFLGDIAPHLDLAVTPLPSLGATGSALEPYLTVEALFRAANGRASETALREVVDLITGEGGAYRRALEGRQVVPHLGARLRPEIASDSVLSAFLSQSDQAIPTPNRAEMSVVWEPSNRALRAVLRGQMESSSALARAQREAESFLRPPPERAASEPYLAAAVALLVALMVYLLVRARRERWLPRIRKARAAYIYLFPAFVGMTVVVLLPFLVGAAVSLFAHHGGEFTFVGLRNFGRILASSDHGIGDPMSFWFTLVVTILWTVTNVLLHVGIGLGLALLLRDPWLRLKGLYRVLLIIPWAVPNYITALIWRGMFDMEYGAITGLLAFLGLSPVAWFSQFATSFAANLITNTWLGFPFMMVVTLGALQAIPRDLEEAASVDGAGPWTRFRHITLPLLTPTLLPAVILGSVWTFNMFNVIYLVSGGEPDGSTEILISEAYKWAFTRQAQYGYAAAYAVLVFGVLLLYTGLTSRVSGAKVS
ncbi:MAG: extracellular solute-binding protein [Myxococcota bacterium]|nr:extracellular solute-binding protein [Myxococcota bacterium]